MRNRAFIFFYRTVYAHRWWVRAALGLLVLITLSACGSSSDTSSETQNVLSDPLNIEFSASRLVLNEGESTLLSWNVSDADSVSIEPNVANTSLSLAGELEVAPTATTTYTLSSYQAGKLYSQQELIVTVRPNAAVSLLATVTEGASPLTVRFTPLVQSSSAINRYYWEFQGDGGNVDGGLGEGANGFDRVRINGRNLDYDVTGQDISVTYNTPGEYPVTVRVWDANGNQDQATTTITVNPSEPIVAATAQTSVGVAPLRVRFYVDIFDQATIGSIQWDFNADGEIDYERSVNRTRLNTSYDFTFESAGVYQPVLTLLDTNGNSRRYELDALKVTATAAGLPGFTVSLSPIRGEAPLLVRHSVSNRFPSGSRIDIYEWDFNGDGVIDATSTDSRVEHTYTKAGVNKASVTAVTEDGQRLTNQFEVLVESTVNLMIETPAINPTTDTAAISATSLADMEFGLQVMSAENQTIKTILPSQMRAAGTYTASWDGTNAAGALQPPGEYYVVAIQMIDGRQQIVDPRSSSGGDIFYPNGWDGFRSCSGSSIDDCGELDISGNELEPFNNLPISYDISSPHNAKMSAYITLIGSDDFAATTFFRSRVMAAGDTKLEWFGTGTDGKMLPYRDRNGYLPAIYGITLASNSIVLNNFTELDNLSVSPAILHPLNGAASRSQSVIKFDLSRRADVTLTIDNTAQGINVLQKSFRDIPAGIGQQLTWDGKDNLGRHVGPGGYVLTVSAIDTFGHATIARKAVQRVEY